MDFRQRFHQYLLQDIRFANERYEVFKHENYDEEFEVFRILTYDYNAPDQDNVTCSMTFTPDKENMFELKNDNDSYSYDCKYVNKQIHLQAMRIFLLYLLST